MLLCELELECGICYRCYNSARRAPRLLGCKHRFCEACLLRQGSSSARPAGESDSQPGIVCALCRHHTALTEAGLKESLPLDEELLERLRAAGSLEAAEDDEEDEEPEPERDGQNKEEEERSPTTRKGRILRAMKKFCNKVRGQDRQGCITDAEMRDLALMSCYMI